MNELIAMFKALGDESRLRLFNVLIEVRTATVSDLEKILSISQTNVSRHLVVLKNAGLIESKRQGNYVVNKLSQNAPVDVVGFVKKKSNELLELKADVNKAREYFNLM
ncbi:MAG: hypothetical protein Kow00108_15130 [Calditrichia bacterium]